MAKRAFKTQFMDTHHTAYLRDALTRLPTISNQFAPAALTVAL